MRLPIHKSLVSIFSIIALFASLATLMFLKHDLSAFIFSIESIGLLYIGMHSRQSFFRYLACLFYFMSGMLLAVHCLLDMLHDHSSLSIYLSGLIVSMTGFVFASSWREYVPPIADIESDLAQAVMLWATSWWYGVAVLYFLNNHTTYYFVTGFLLFAALSSFVFWLLVEIFDWNWLKLPALFILPFMIAYAAYTTIFSLHSSDIQGVWIMCFCVLYSMLYRSEKKPLAGAHFIYAISFLLLIYVLTDQFVNAAYFHQASSTTQFIIWSAVPAFALFLLTFITKIDLFPSNHTPLLYQHGCAEPLALFLLCWLFASSLFTGDLDSLHYLPLLNPLDMTVLVNMSVLLYWGKQNQKWLMNEFALPTLTYLRVFAYFIFFIIGNTIVFRVLTHTLHLPYDVSTLFHSVHIKMIFATIWSLALLSGLLSTFMYYKRHQC